MSGFRGIFLDSIHPLIVKRLDADTHAFKQMGIIKNQGADTGIGQGSKYEYASTTEAYKYFSERTVWMRVVPFAIPQTKYTLNPNYVFANSPNGIGGDGDASSYMVPQWRDWVLWGTKAAGIHGGVTSVTGRSPEVPYGDVLTSTGQDTGKDYHSNNMFGWGGKHGMYRRDSSAWDGTTRDGIINSPVPGLTGMQVSNKGDLGTIRRASFDIKVHNLMDLEAIEMMYMVPGLSVLIEWGWYHPKLFMEPIDIELIKSGDRLASTNTINTEILKKSFGIQESSDLIGDPTALYDLDSLANRDDGPLGPPAGIYDGLLGIATKFNWTNDGQGGYDCRVDCISPGSLAGGIPAESFALGGSELIEKQEIPVTDLRTIIAMVKKETREIESKPTAEYVEGQLKTTYKSIELVKNKAKGSVKVDGNIISGKVPPYMLKTSEYGIKIELDTSGGVDNPSLKFTKTTSTTDGSGDYYISGYKGSDKNRQSVKQIHGDRTWWNKIMHYCGKSSLFGWDDEMKIGSKDSSTMLMKKGARLPVDEGMVMLDLDRCDLVLDVDYDNERETLANMDYEWGTALRNGDFTIDSNKFFRLRLSTGYITSKTSGWTEEIYFNDADYWYPHTIKALGYARMELPDQEHIPLGERQTVSSFIEIPGYTNQRAAKGKYGWTDDGNGGWKDKSGKTVIQAGQWGSNELDPIIVTEHTGVTVYKREKGTADGTFVYTEVASVENITADAVAEAVKATASGINVEIKAAATKELNDKIAKDAAITAAASNFGAVTWANGSGNIVAFDEDATHVGIYANAYPGFAPPIHHLTDLTYQASELGYDILPQDTTPKYPIGMVAYSETYLSWRFVEDYLINELYMPRAVQPGVDTNNDPKVELDTTFMSANRCSDREKHLLGDTFLTKYAGLIEKVDNTLTDSSRNREVYHSQHIINHPSLRSFNPAVCILPGQERHPIVMEKAKETLATEAALSGDMVAAEQYAAKTDLTGGGYLIDNMTDKKAAARIKGDTVLNRFAGLNQNGEFDESIGTLRNIMINAKLLEEAAAKTTNVRKFVLTVLDKVNKACGEPWKFKMLTNSALGKMSIIDENYTPLSNVKSYEEGSGTYLDTGDGGVNAIGVYKFSGIGTDNILKDVKIQSKIPNELQTMAYYSTLGSNNDKGSEVQMFNMYRAGIVDRLRSISSVTVLGNSTGSEASTLQAEAKMILSHAELLPTTRMNQTNGLKANEAVGEGEKVAKAYCRKFIHGDTVTVGGYRPPIPIDVSLTMHGVSGIYMGNAIMIKTIDEGGLLPSRYRNNVALQATAVDHSISPEGWSTSISTLMRPLPDAEYTPSMKVKIKRSRPQSIYVPSDLPIGNPYGSSKQWKINSQFGNEEAFRKGSHGGLDIGSPIGTPYVCCLPNASVSFRKQTGSKDWVANGTLDADGNPTIGSGVKLANTNGYGYYVRMKGKGFGAAGEKITYQIDYGHCEGFIDPNGDGTVMDFEEMHAYGKAKGWKVDGKTVKVPGTVSYGVYVGTCGGDRRMKGAGNSLGKHLHMTIKVGGEPQDPQLMVQDYYVAPGGGKNDHFDTGGNG